MLKKLYSASVIGMVTTSIIAVGLTCVHISTESESFYKWALGFYLATIISFVVSVIINEKKEHH